MRAVADERGLAVPTVLPVLLILSTLVLGLCTLSATEPVIAANHLLATQSRALAEAGVERALWALNHPAAPGGLALPRPLAASWTSPAPYDGAAWLPVGVADIPVGGFRVVVTPASSSAEVIITSVGWAPAAAGLRPTAHRRVQVRAFNPRLLFKDPAAALSVRGGLEVAGNARVDARGDATCGAKAGALATGATALAGVAANVWGADGNDVPGQSVDAHQGGLPAVAADLVQNVGAAAFDARALTDADIAALRAHARSHGTYRRGGATFGPGTPMPNGVVFVDTASGAPITRPGAAPASPAADIARVAIADGAPADPSGVWSGYLFVNGSVSISGPGPLRGFVYAQNDFAYRGAGSGVGIRGAVMSRNIRDLSSSVDSDLLGQARIAFDCEAARTGGGQLPDRWTIQMGSYRELEDS